MRRDLWWIVVYSALAGILIGQASIADISGMTIAGLGLAALLLLCGAGIAARLSQEHDRCTASIDPMERNQ